MIKLFETPRLWLREMTPGDLDFIAAMMGDPEVSRFYEREFTRTDSADWLTRQIERYANDGHGLWLVIERTTGAPVGQVGIAMQHVEDVREPEIGWLLHRAFWGRGYATEAALAILEDAHRRWGYEQLISLIRPVNVPSRRVAERIGMTPGRHVDFHGFDHIVFERTLTTD
jgi:RimJ/RimL family protein N-acetyltransferase